MLSTLVRAARPVAARRAIATHARTISRVATLHHSLAVSRRVAAVAAALSRRQLSTPADSSSSVKHAGSSSAAPVEPADEQVRTGEGQQ